MRGSSLRLGAQNCYAEDKGAFTGEVSPAMLAGLGDDVLLGHSERRHVLGESDELIARKLVAARRHGLRVILAVGETEAERLEGTHHGGRRPPARGARWRAWTDVADGELVVAYEPVWAIGTGRTATPAQAEEVCAHIATRLAQLLGEVAEQRPRSSTAAA